jgi:hypothetical protein
VSGSERTEADLLIKYAIEGTRKRIDVPSLVRKYASDDSRTVVVQVLLRGSPLGYGFYIDPASGALELCNPQDIARPTVVVPIALEGIFILLDPDRKEGPLDVYSMGLMPGFSGAQFLAHLRLLHAIFKELKTSLQEYARQEARRNAQPS